MIPQAAVESFLEAPKDDHRWIKKVPKKELWSALGELDPPFSAFQGARRHQLACLLLGTAYPRFSFWLDMGAGKTLVALELIRYWHQMGKCQRALVFITSDKALPTWLNQMERFEIDVPGVAITSGSSAEKWATLDMFDRGGIVFVTYPGAVAMVTKRQKSGRKYKMVLDPKLVDRLAEGLDVVVFDESTKAGHRTSLTHKLALQLSRKAKFAYNLAGRPLGRDPTLLWGQQYLVDFGESLGATLGLFREAFFSAEDNFWGGPYSKTFKFKKSAEPELARMRQHRSISYGADECIELPPFLPTIERVRLPEDTQEYYNKAAQSLKEARINMRQLKNEFVRMRQMTSGFLGFKDDETGEKAEIEFGSNPKLERLLELIEEVPEDRKALIFYEFTWSGRRIAAELKDRKLEHIWLWSGTKDSKGDLKRFMTKDSCRFAVIQSKVGAYSLDGLQVANYLFFYESPVSVIDREQAERRARRQGQLHKVFQYDLVAKGTVDERILHFHKEGEDIFQALMRERG